MWDKILPMHFHIDGTKVFKASGSNVEVAVYSISSALVSKTSLKCKIPITLIV